ncbi:MAG: type II toxin-antitoxin system HicB family antitoxin [Candidatus Gastranaerophilaceae bacterium]
MKLKVVIHKEDDGFWAEVPALKGCFTQGETIDDIKKNIKESIEGWFSVDLPSLPCF